MRGKITLLSSSLERRMMLEEMGFCVLLPHDFIDVETRESAICEGSAKDFAQSALDAKLNAYTLAGAMAKTGKYILADTVASCVLSDGRTYVLGKCLNLERARIFLDFYSESGKVSIITSQYVIDVFGDGRCKRSFSSDWASISFVGQDGANMMTESFKVEYLSKRSCLGRAGAVDAEAFSKAGFEISGKLMVIRGLCPF